MFRKTLATLPTQATRMLNATARPSSIFATRLITPTVSQIQSQRSYHEKDEFSPLCCTRNSLVTIGSLQNYLLPKAI